MNTTLNPGNDQRIETTAACVCPVPSEFQKSSRAESQSMGCKAWKQPMALKTIDAGPLGGGVVEVAVESCG